VATHKLMIAVYLALFSLVVFSADGWCQDRLIELSVSGEYQLLRTQEWQNDVINKEQLNQIVRDTLHIQTYEPTFVSEFLAKDLNHDGENEIVASVNKRCTSDPVMFILLFRIGKRGYLQEFRTHMGNINRDIKDINGDGNLEVLTKEILAESTCHAECVEWPEVYKWDGRRYVEASEDFPEYYKKIIENLDARLKQLSEIDLEELAMSDKRTKEELAEWQQFRIADTQVARFKAKQLLGEGKAGFNHAVQWSSSMEYQLRRNAVTVFAGIMDSKSKRYLEKLATDSESTVARSAATALRSGLIQVPFSVELNSDEMGKRSLQHVCVVALEKGPPEDRFWNPTLYKISVEAGVVLEEKKLAEQGAPIFCYRMKEGQVMAAISDGMASNGTTPANVRTTTEFTIDMNDMRVLDTRVRKGNNDDIEEYRKMVLSDKHKKLEGKKPAHLAMKKGEVFVGGSATRHTAFMLRGVLGEKRDMALDVLDPNTYTVEGSISLDPGERKIRGFLGGDHGNAALIDERYVVLLFLGDSRLGVFAPSYVVIVETETKSVKYVAIGSDPACGIAY